MPRRPALLDNGRAKALGAYSRCGGESGGGGGGGGTERNT